MAGVTPSEGFTTSSASRTTPASRPSLFNTTSLSLSPSSRIAEILETGRRRSVQFAQAELTPKSYSQYEEDDEEDEGQERRNPMSHAREPSSVQSDVNVEESSADEQTAIIRRDRERRAGSNYQSTAANSLRATGTHTNNTLNNRRSASIRNNGETGGEQPSADGDEQVRDEGWWKRQIEKYGSVELENKGSVARDHLALERTFLAWLRTSLAFASIGIAITQLFRLNTSINGGTSGSDPYLHLRQLGKPLGATFLAISILVLFIGFHRYFESQHWIIRGKFPASRGSIAIVAIVAFCLMVTSLIVVVVVEPSAFEKRD